MAGKVQKSIWAIRNPVGPITQAVGAGSRSGQWPAQSTEEMKARVLVDQDQGGTLSDVLNPDNEEEARQRRPRRAVPAKTSTTKPGGHSLL